jgi:aspartokinase
MSTPLVFKFGGASVKDAESVRNVAAIIERYPDRPMVVVVSAMGKMTNAFESVVGIVGHRVIFLARLRHFKASKIFMQASSQNCSNRYPQIYRQIWRNGMRIWAN